MKPQKSNTYLKFDKSRMVNLEYSLSREILRTNRKGAYHCTTLVECNTRKQHGLLVMPIAQFDGENHVLLSSFDETVIQHGAEFNLGIHKYDGGNYNPMGHKYIREFSCDYIPKTIYRVGGVILAKEKMFSLKTNTILIRYTLLDAHSPTTIRFKPFLAFREINELTYENSMANHGYKEVENGISMCMYTGYPTLHMQFNKKVDFIFDPHWNKGIEYPMDMANGVPYKEDLYVPGYFELPIKKGESIVFSASDTPANVNELLSEFETEALTRTPRSSFLNCLKNSAEQFFYSPEKGKLFILDGYPWGKVLAREQFFSLPAFTLDMDRPNSFESVMDTAMPTIEAFLRGETLKGNLSDIGSSDVILLVVRALKKLFNYDKERFFAKYAELPSQIINFILANNHPNMKVEPDLLVTVDSRINSTNWMHDPRNNDYSKIGRTGLLVEVNAFWFNSLMFAAEVAKETGNKSMEDRMIALADRVRKSFEETFINENGYLYDYVDGSYKDPSVRPNMLLALAADYPLLDKHISKSMLEIITKELLTAKGLRSLSPKSIGFQPRMEGSLENRVYSAYNGGSWPWMLSLYMEAYHKIFQRSGLSFISRLLIDLEYEMSNDCLGSLSTVYDGSSPYAGHGQVSYSMSVAGVLQALLLQEEYLKDY